VITDYFTRFGIFTASEVEAIVELFTTKSLQKNDFFVQQGERCKAIAFIQSGIFRSYYATAAGKDNTYCFRFPNQLMASYSSFITGKPSDEYMQAISEATIFVASKVKLDELAADNPKWLLFLKNVAEQEYLELESRFFQLQRDTAQERYAALLRDQPNYIQEIPLQYLASYLGITQRHLSRIRRELIF